MDIKTTDNRFGVSKAPISEQWIKILKQIHGARNAVSRSRVKCISPVIAGCISFEIIPTTFLLWGTVWRIITTSETCVINNF